MTSSLPVEGLASLVVEVLSVQDSAALVRSQFGGKQIQVRRDIGRAHAPWPQIGEQWIIDRSFSSEWTFAAIIGGDEQRPVGTVADAAARTAIQAKYINMAVYQLDSFSVWVWNGTIWVEWLPPPIPPAPEARQVACSVILGVDVPLSGGDDVVASGSWLEDFNEGGYVTHLSGGASWIQVPTAGQYMIDYQICFEPYTTGGFALHACKVMLNAATLDQVVATDTTNSVGIGEGTWLHAHNDVLLAAGDKLYWQVYSSGDSTLLAAAAGVPSRLKVRRLGPN
jgi:hypothetical protein